ncbi:MULTISPECIES: hypothetical protein [Sphingobium]|jgi:hypothetical protein|uniref:Uncharacterized protein n=1 Tax=Sphingobium lactosutens DS20 TaxID=1331060 RepID=T0IST6_9SPHN|nr:MULTISPECIES: hypothetical protein [Sphingobium]EQB14880.1 hypothetical protein RLDS_11975 [Sphingobium lactosutens DS20]
MRAQRQSIAKQVAGRLFAAEEAIDIAVARIAELNAALPLARLDARLSAMIGQDAIQSSASAMLLISETREKIVITHANLKQASDAIGLTETSYGDLLKVAGDTSRPSGQHLRAV